MAATCDINIIAHVFGLGQVQGFAAKFATKTPTLAMSNYQNIQTTEEGEALEIGEMGTIELIIIKNLDSENYVEIDSTWVTPFVAQMKVGAGQVAVFKPSGTVYLKANSSAVNVEYIAVASA